MSPYWDSKLNRGGKWRENGSHHYYWFRYRASSQADLLERGEIHGDPVPLSRPPLRVPARWINPHRVSVANYMCSTIHIVIFYINIYPLVDMIKTKYCYSSKIACNIMTWREEKKKNLEPLSACLRGNRVRRIIPIPCKTGEFFVGNFFLKVILRGKLISTIPSINRRISHGKWGQLAYADLIESWPEDLVWNRDHVKSWLEELPTGTPVSFHFMISTCALPCPLKFLL